MKFVKFIIILMVSSFCMVNVLWAAEVGLNVNGQKRETDNPLLNNNGVVMISIDDLAWAIGGLFETGESYDGDYKIINYGDRDIRFIRNGISLDKSDYVLNSENVDFKIQPFTDNDVFYLPLRETIEYLTDEVDIEWIEESSIVNIKPPYREEIIKKEEALKIKYNPIDKLTLTYGHEGYEEKTIVLENSENIKSAMKQAAMLPYYHNKYITGSYRMLPFEINYNIEYSGGENINVKFYNIYDFDELFKKVLFSQEVKMQTMNLFNEEISKYRYIKLSNNMMEDIIIDRYSDENFVNELIKICRDDELEKDFNNYYDKTYNPYNGVEIYFSDDSSKNFESFYYINLVDNEKFRELFEKNSLYDKLISPLSNIESLIIYDDEGKEIPIIDDNLKLDILENFSDGTTNDSIIGVKIVFKELKAKRNEYYGSLE